jgi:hypothetical protein
MWEVATMRYALAFIAVGVIGQSLLIGIGSEEAG